ncbi:rab GTPase-activating protein 1 [Hippoglossus stenolepis]|uniref:rab GTPase-activating protein 1 n=1 Tax=Hippoglossus stenolepis TaxID=195615 RepID=UPI001FB015A1|nr:rab GTPase-activating protein 1 [Hippoglossus stenolepis]
MRRRSSRRSSVLRRSSSSRRRSDNLHFDEFGFNLTRRKEQKVHHRCHEYSYPPLSSQRVKELCELLSYWNGSSFICRSQIERFIRMGVPPTLRGRVWRCLLGTDGLRESSDFNYQKCLLEVRGPLVDLGVSEYGILSAIATLSDTQNDLDLNHQPSPDRPEPCYSVDDITLFRQIALDLQRSFPTHRSLMGESPEAIEGQAKLFRVLIAYGKYNPQVGYTQGMSYIAAVLLMQLGEEEAFWALTALLDKPKYLAELFDLSLSKVQHQVKVFDQFLKHRKPKLSQHLESVGVLSVHFVMPWFLTLFTALPCWDSVLAAWDLIILHGLSAVFRIALTIIDLLEPRLMEQSDEGAVLPLLLRVPVDVAKYTVLIPALWNTEVQDWEIKCMNSLVLDESHHGSKTDMCENPTASVSNQSIEDKDEENAPVLPGGGKPTEKDSVTRAKSVLTRVMRLAQRYLIDPMGRQRTEEKSSQVKTRQRSPAPGRVFRSRTSTSLTKAQIRSRRRGQQEGRAHQPTTVQGGGGGDVTVTDPAGGGKSDGAEQTFTRAATEPVGKAARHHSNHSIRVKSLRLLRSGKNPSNHTPPPSSSFPPPSLRSSTLPPLSSIPASNPPSSGASQSREEPKQQDTPRMAFIRELSSRHQISGPLRNARESTLI